MFSVTCVSRQENFFLTTPNIATYTITFFQTTLAPINKLYNISFPKLYYLSLHTCGYFQISITLLLIFRYHFWESELQFHELPNISKGRTPSDKNTRRPKLTDALQLYNSLKLQQTWIDNKTLVRSTISCSLPKQNSFDLFHLFICLS